MPIVLNADNLAVKLGVVEGQSGKAGEWQTPTSQRVIDLEIPLASLTASSTIIDNDAIIDKGYLVESVAVVGTAAVAGTATSINVGVVYAGDRSSNAVATGILNTQLNANLALGNNGTVATGASVKAITTQNLLLTAQANGGTYTAGVVRVQITVSKP